MDASEWFNAQTLICASRPRTAFIGGADLVVDDSLRVLREGLVGTLETSRDEEGVWLLTLCRDLQHSILTVVGEQFSLPLSVSVFRWRLLSCRGCAWIGLTLTIAMRGTRLQRS